MGVPEDLERSATAASCEVTVPFATIMLENCMPLLASRGSWSPAVALPGPPGFSVARQVQAKHGAAQHEVGMGQYL